MPGVYLKYFKTNEPVLVGDRIKVKSFWGEMEGEVVYVPNQSELNPNLGEDTWAIQLDSETSDIRSMPFYPNYEKFAPRKITLIKRNPSTKDIKVDEDIL